MTLPAFIREELSNLSRRYDGPIPNTARWDACRPQAAYSYTIREIEEAREYLGAQDDVEALLILSQWEARWRSVLGLPESAE